MTDEQLDARLRAAGEAWRAANDPSIAVPSDLDEPLMPPGRSHPHGPRRTAVFAAAAVVTAALVAGAGFLLSGGNTHKRATDAAATPLEGTVWRLVDDGHRHADNSLATLYISTDGRLVADDECTLLDLRIDVRGRSLVPTRSNLRQRDCTDITGPAFVRDPDVFIGRINFHIVGPRLTLALAGTDLHLVAAPELPRPSADVPTRVGATWRLVKVLDADGTSHPVTGRPTFKIDNGRLDASDGCNTLSGPVGPDGRPLGSGGFIITERACVDPAATATAAVVDAVLNGSPPGFRTAGTTLTLKKDRVGELTYEWIPENDQAVDENSLIGRTWHLASIAGEPAAADATLRIDAGNNLTANDGCGAFGAIAHLAPGSLSVAGRPNQPEAGCPKAAADQATTFDSFLNQKPALWTIRSGRLQIYGGGAQAFSLVFTPDVAVPPGAGLTGVDWRLLAVAVTNPDNSSGEGASSFRVTLKLAGDRYTVTTPCGTGSGRLTIGADAMDFGAVDDSSGPYCLNGDAVRQAQKTLTGTVHFAVANGQLVMTKGKVQLTFER